MYVCNGLPVICMSAPGMLKVVVTVASALVVPAIVVKFSSDPIVHKEDHACKCKCDTQWDCFI
jgi:hypothetical protein